MSALDHVDDYPEIPVSLASTRTALKTGAWRSVRPVMEARRAPCTAACPAGVDIPRYLHDLANGRHEAALAAFTDRNPFPRITGRVCPHLCEDVCNLAVGGDHDPLAIRSIERWLGDDTAALPHAQPDRPTGHRVAVVGSGPAGMTAAFFLCRSGHEVTVFERRSEAGGILRYGIPDYRLPAAVVDAEIARLEAMGIEFRTGVELGVDVTLDDLEADFAAVFVATGAWRERRLEIAGAELLERGLAFLESVNRGEAALPGERCAVIGAGNTAMDVARVLRKLGADVTVLYRRTAAEMPAIREEYELAAADGVTFQWLTIPRAIEKDKLGLMVTVEDVRLGTPDASGRPRPEPTGITRELRFDAVFAATGESADLDVLPERLRRDDGWLDVSPDGATRDPLVYAGGDLATGPATVIRAIAAGRRAARAIDRQLGYEERWPAEAVLEVVDSTDVNRAYVPRRDRAGDPAHPTANPFAEETRTLSQAAARFEIERCLSCGHCNECRTCYLFCPDGAITWDGGPVIDYEFCKGCGICVVECPGHSMVLVNEREASRA